MRLDAEAGGLIEVRARLAPNAPFQTALGPITTTFSAPGHIDIDPGDNTASFLAVTTKHAADLAVVGRTPGDTQVTDVSLHGKVGSVLSLQTLPWNNGPSVSVDGLTLTITAPNGTSILSAAPGCQLSADRKTARCTTHEPIELSPRDPTTIRLRLDAPPGGSDGSIVVSGSLPDPNPANNLRKIAVTVTGQPAGGSGSAAGNGGTGGTGGAAGDGGGTLPATGTPHLLGLALAGLATLLTGVTLTVGTRRHQRPTTR